MEELVQQYNSKLAKKYEMLAKKSAGRYNLDTEMSNNALW